MSQSTEAIEKSESKPKNNPRVVPHDAWRDARIALLAKEKAFTEARDALTAERRALPMERVEKSYLFDEPSGTRSLADLFGGKRQLIVYHFMFDPSWDEGCKSCSFVADHIAPAMVHLAARDTAFAVVSRAPLAKIEPFKARMGWTFRWLSSGRSDFNDDYHVSFRPEDIKAKRVEYNYRNGSFSKTEAPGISVFLRANDEILHTYSTYGRGLDLMIGAYNYLDLTPLGRQESDLPYSMAWVRHHDKY